MSLSLVDNDHVRSVWMSRALCMSRQGKTGDMVVGNMRDCEPGLQASIWLSIAESSPFKEEQLNGFSRALSILRNEDSPELIEMLLSYGRWSLQKGFGFKKVKITLEEAEELAKRYMRKDWQDEAPSSKRKNPVVEQSSGENKPGKQEEPSIVTSQTFSQELSLNMNLISLEEEFRLGVLNRKNFIASEIEKKKMAESRWQPISHEKEFRENSENNVRILEQLFRIHSMKAMVAKRADDQVTHLDSAGMYMKLALKVTFKRYIQLLRDKMEQPGNLTQGESILASREGETVSKIQTSEKETQNLTSEIKQEKGSGTDRQMEHEIEISSDYEDNLRLKFPVGLLNLIANNRETNIICKASFNRESLTLYYLLKNLELLQQFGIQRNCDIFILVMKLISQAFFKSPGVHTLVMLVSALNAKHFRRNALAKAILVEALSGPKIEAVLHQINLEIELNSNFVF